MYNEYIELQVPVGCGGFSCKIPMSVNAFVGTVIIYQRISNHSSTISSRLFSLYQKLLLSECCLYLGSVVSFSGESKPERTGTPFQNPAKSKKSVPGPQNVRIFTGTIASSPFRGPKHSPFLCQGLRSIHFL